MLVLSRRCRESIVLPADGVTIRVLEIRANRVRLGIEAPSGVSVLRGELICDVTIREPGQAAEPELQKLAAHGPSDNGPSQGHRASGGRPLRHAVAASPRPWAPQASHKRPAVAALGRSE
jgi:carbon storage regulator